MQPSQWEPASPACAVHRVWAHPVSNSAMHQTHSACSNQLHSTLSVTWMLPHALWFLSMGTAGRPGGSSSQEPWEGSVQHFLWTDKSNIQRYQTNGGSTQTELIVWRESKANIKAHTSRSESWSCCRGTNHSLDWFHIHLIYLCTFHTSLTRNSDSEQGAVNSGTHLVYKAYQTSVIFEDMIAC